MKRIIPIAIIEERLKAAREEAVENLIMAGIFNCANCGVWYENTGDSICPACGHDYEDD